MSKKGGKFDFLAEEREQRSIDGEMAREGETESAQARKRTNAQSIMCACFSFILGDTQKPS